MAISYRFPVLVWEDSAGTFTAKLVEYEENINLIYGYYFGDSGNASTAFGVTKDDAIFKLKEYIGWSYQKYPWQPEPDFLDAKIIYFSVEIRPEYKYDGKTFPVSPINIKFPCVYGKQEEGLLVCTLPTIGINFYYYENNTLKDLVVHYVQEKLKGITPKELSRYLPPKKVYLEEIVVLVNYKSKHKEHTIKLHSLSAVAQPVTEKGSRHRFGRAWERDAELADLVNRISKEKANIIVIGDTGVGKSTLIKDAAGQIERQLRRDTEDGDEYENYKHKFWLTNGARIIAGMKYLGQWEERCEDIIRELSDINGVLCIDSLLDIVNTGGESPVNGIAAFLLPYLQRRELRMIVEATPTELDVCRRLIPGFVDLFQIVKLESFSRDKAILILDKVSQAFGQNFSIQVTKGITELIYRLFNRFMPYQSFPGKTVGFLRELFEQASQHKKDNVSIGQVIKLFIEQTGLPELFLRDEITLPPNEVVNELTKQVIGQLTACQTVTNLITTFKAGLNDPDRPIGVLLFCGPTGVGKTELAKALAKFFFGAGAQKDRLIRLDMSEYSVPGSATRLIGANFNQPSELIRKVRQQPFVVLLLDEIEKADKEVFDLFLGLFDEGRLTDQYGRTTIFRSSIIIMTSNIGADKFNTLGFSKQSQTSYTSAVMDFFRPEFYNRMDVIVNFNALTAETLSTITEKELQELAKREGIEKAKLKVSWTKNLVKYLAKEGFEPRYGARPLQRTIEKLVTVPLAKFLIENPDLENTAIKLDVDDKGKVFFQINKNDHHQ